MSYLSLARRQRAGHTARCLVAGASLLFVTAADRKVHVYDSASGKQLWELQLGGLSTGSPSMYELAGRQYLLVSASSAGAAAGAGPTGIVAYALPRN